MERSKYSYVVIIRGIYRHNILGVYTSSREARQCAWLYFSRSTDAHHDVEVVRRVTNKFHHWQDPEYGWVYSYNPTEDEKFRNQFKVTHTKYGELFVR